jgi:hypothetical protein
LSFNSTKLISKAKSILLVDELIAKLRHVQKQKSNPLGDIDSETGSEANLHFLIVNLILYRLLQLSKIRLPKNTRN